MSLNRVGTAIDNMTSNHRGIQAGSAFCWLYKAWAEGNEERGIVKLPESARVVEVGNGGLHSLGYLLDVAPKGWTIYAVDPYVGEGRFAEFIKTAHERLGDVIDRVTFLRWPSPQVADLFLDESLDAVLIDGDHDYIPVAMDIAAWQNKIVPGGYIAGDDVDPDFPGCERAWEEAYGADTVKLWGSTAVVRLYK